MIATAGLSKHYGSATALEGLDLEVREGEVYGLLGPNGSGKTTTIRLLLGLIRPSSGSASVCGFDSWSESRAVRERVSYLPGELRLFGAMTGFGLLRFLSSLRGGKGLDRAVEIAETVMGLDLRRKVRQYSTGMKQKLALSQAFADPVEILILDEPTSALDPSARALVLKLVREAKAGGQTVVFSGHVLSEVEEVADRVAIMKLGRLMHVEDLRDRGGLRLVLLRYGEAPPDSYPEGLGLALRRRDGAVDLLEHRGPVGPLLDWMRSVDVVDLAVGLDDLKGLYDRYHGTGA